jgi:predicted RND superfamily exporter protein
MWYKSGQFILKFRVALLVFLAIATAVMSYFASKVTLSYDFSRAVPVDNIKYLEYQDFLKKFGNDGSTLVIGIQSDHFFTNTVFNEIGNLHQQLKKVNGVLNIASIPETVVLLKDSVTGKIKPEKIFHYPYRSQPALDSAKAEFGKQKFYRDLLYHPETNAYLMAVDLNKDSINSASRTRIVTDVMEKVADFEKRTGISLHVSGLPYIRTLVADRIKAEMRWFLIGSILLSAFTLFMFFRSASATLMSLAVVGMGVVFCFGTMGMFGYKITLLSALIPILVVVIGVPNCIYFLNKYHTSFRGTTDKNKAIVQMVGRMGIVTLFCNIAAAIGFTVFAFTSSQLLKEFGIVSGINIMGLFFISLFFIPPVLSYLPAPQPKHVRYLDNKILEKILLNIEKWALYHAKWVYAISIAIVLIAGAGIFRLKSEGFIVDDLPQNDKIYTDLKWFENNFRGVMPLEIMVDTKKKRGVLKMETLQNIETLSDYMYTNENVARPISIVEALKFGNQAFYNGDSSSYMLPMEIPASIANALRNKTGNKSEVERLAAKFIDSTQEFTRISVNMKDIGSKRLPLVIADFEKKAASVFDSSKYKITFTGSSVSFLEGSTFIINGLKESIFWAFLLIAFCMLFLFRSFRILLFSLIPNIIPLFITAGVMGWAGISLRPSTVLVFSVALGIVIDVTIRFLINYKQELPHFNFQVQPTLVQTIRHTGISIIYTSLVLIAGFIIFCFSKFGGTFALGWLTSLTLLMGTLTNLILLPVLIMSLSKKQGLKP